MKPSLSAFTDFFKQHRIECAAYTLFMGLAICGLCMHEPLYDECQAWMIAKTATWHDILVLIPTYEGHPPFWHLLLAVPAKLGISWHTAATCLGIVFMALNGFLLFFKAPFPRWVRCLLPFSFFLFYQYGIIVRPYSLMVTFLLLLALYFPQKDKRPTLFIGLLALLCMCHLYGIAIAGGIVLAWLWEKKQHSPWKIYLASLYKDPVFHKMFILLLWVALLGSLLVDMGGSIKQAFYTSNYLKQILYVFLAMPAESVLTNFDYSVHITRSVLPWGGLLYTCVCGLLLWACVCTFFARKYILYLLLPYLFTGTIMVLYSSSHHIGLVLLLFIWYAWITLNQFPIRATRYAPINWLGRAVLAASLIIPIGWSAFVFVQDYRLNLFDGKQIVNFLRKYNLMDENIFVSWTMVHKGDINYDANVNLQPMGVMMNMYLPYNIIANFHGKENKGYLVNHCPDWEQTTRILKQWVSLGKPTVLLDSTPITYLYNDPSLLQEYHAAFLLKEYRPWKFNQPEIIPHGVYLHDTLWEKYKDQILAEHSKEKKPSGRLLSVVKNTNNTLTINVAFDEEDSHDNTHN